MMIKKCLVFVAWYALLGASAQAISPVETVRAMVRETLSANKKKINVFLDAAYISGDLLRFERHLDDAHWRNFDADPITGLQDSTGLNVAKISQNGKVVTVDYRDGKSTSAIEYLMVQENGYWKVDDIIYPKENITEGDSFRHIMTKALVHPSSLQREISERGLINSSETDKWQAAISGKLDSASLTNVLASKSQSRPVKIAICFKLDANGTLLVANVCLKSGFPFIDAIIVHNIQSASPLPVSPTNAQASFVWVVTIDDKRVRYALTIAEASLGKKVYSKDRTDWLKRVENARLALIKSDEQYHLLQSTSPGDALRTLGWTKDEYRRKLNAAKNHVEELTTALKSIKAEEWMH